jgi:orotate phosphoribosyltransferase
LKNELAKKIFTASHLIGAFTLRSGQVSNEYFDKYLFESDPALLSAIADAMAALIPAGTQVLAGLEMGGIPIAVALSLRSGVPAAFVRKQAKQYGTRKLTEGAVAADVLCVIERDRAGRIKLEAAGLKLRALFSMDELNAAKP